ncbi:SGNH/GDSL hydrolase family protein [Escherichia coli]|nr:SGNH/GDSL hydrolase family protein [Escherichia coli]
MAFNPELGSTSPAVLLDNAKRLDELTNGPAATVPDRAGEPLDSWRKMQDSISEKIQEISNVIDSVDNDGFTFSSRELGLASTTEGQFFRVVILDGEGVTVAFDFYQNKGGVAVFQTSQPNKRYVDSVNQRVTKLATDYTRKDYYGGMKDDKNRLPFHFDSKANVILKRDINITAIGKEYPQTKQKAFTAYGYGFLFKSRRFAGGFCDPLGRLPFTYDFKGDPYFKGKPAREFLGVNELHKSIYGNECSVSVFGDSLSFGAGTGSPPNGWMEQLAAEMPELSFRKFAVGGQTASEIATRQGGFVNLLTLQGNTIPASGSVNVTAQKYRPITVNSAGAGQTNLKGTLFGVHGTLNATYDSSGNMLTNTFTRTTPGNAVYVDPESAFILDSNDSEYDIQILCYGRNDVYAVDFRERVLSALSASIAHMKYLNKRFIVISIPNRTGLTEIKGSAVYNNIISVNKDAQSLAPESYLDIRSQLVRAYNPAVIQDVIDFNNDCPPSSLMFDETHPNQNGYTVWKDALKKFIIDKGWNKKQS